jgi:hypothetical protein
MIDAVGRPGGGGLLSKAAPLALSIGLFYASAFMPPLGMLAPAPLFYALGVNGKKIGFATIMAGAFLLLFVGGPVFSVFYLIFCGLTAWIMAETLDKGATLEATIGLSAMAPFLAGIGFFYMMSGGAESGLTGSLTNWATLAMGAVLKSYSASGADPEMTTWLTDNSKEIIATFVKIFYGISFVSALVTVVINYIVIKTFSLRFGWGIDFGDHNFATWSAPDTLVWGLIGGGFAAFLDDGIAGTMGINLAIISAAIYLFHGLAIIHFYFLKTGFPMILRALGYFFVFSQPIIMLIVGFVGLTDLWLDYRKISPAKTGEPK